MARIPSVVKVGQHLGEDQIPDEQLQVDRHIAEKFDVDVTDFAHQKVGRKPPNTHQHTQNRGQHDADHGHLERVEHANGKGHEVRAVVCVLDHRFADVKAKRLKQKVVATLDAAQAHVGERVAHQQGHQRQSRQDGDDLVDDRTPFAAAPRNRSAFLAGQGPGFDHGKMGHGNCLENDGVVKNTPREGRIQNLQKRQAINAAVRRTSGRPCSTGCSSHVAG